ncbi:hypothetical protein L596_025335 [Steinernema carpocapsae]|uniref:Uncharacterized protein n=1 Tax=Steinernema carpocapsae TaxID=34508 RepID=A0A4U5M7H6_STECR|nr:hypothetical protein L596_025335 [Steinernema carpocapsae]
MERFIPGSTMRLLVIFFLALCVVSVASHCTKADCNSCPPGYKARYSLGCDGSLVGKGFTWCCACVC